MHGWIMSAIAAVAITAPSPALAWGQTGHRTIGDIADQHLSGLARAHVQQLLGVETLAEASTWADEMRSNPDPFWQKTAGPWHYVTVPGLEYAGAPPEGDAYTALEMFSKQLRDPATSREQRQLALRFIIHIIGDLHQPLHVGRPGDRGGNDVKVKWFGRDTNLHVVWDTHLVDHLGLSYTELAERLHRHTISEEVIAWWTADPRDWIRESAQIRKTLYPANPNLSWDYVYEHMPAVELRLKQGGVRTAAYLNALFDEPAGARK
jgi:hypothetical protein